MQTTILDKLMSNDPLNCTGDIISFITRVELLKRRVSKYRDQLNSHEKGLGETSEIELLKSGKYLANFSEKLQPEELPNLLKELNSKIDLINLSANDFIKEMRYNAYEIPQGARRDAYAIDCWNFIQSCRNSQLILLQTIEDHKEDPDQYIKDCCNLLGGAAHGYRIGYVYSSFEDYFHSIIEARDLQDVFDSDFWEDKLENAELELSATLKTTRKEKNISLKQQMILLDTLGFLKNDVWGKANTKDKGFILSHLLNRSEQETRSMLTYWEGTKPPTAYDCTGADDNDAITDMVSDKGLNV